VMGIEAALQVIYKDIIKTGECEFLSVDDFEEVL